MVSNVLSLLSLQIFEPKLSFEKITSKLKEEAGMPACQVDIQLSRRSQSYWVIFKHAEARVLLPRNPDIQRGGADTNLFHNSASSLASCIPDTGTRGLRSIMNQLPGRHTSTDSQHASSGLKHTIVAIVSVRQADLVRRPTLLAVAGFLKLHVVPRPVTGSPVLDVACPNYEIEPLAFRDIIGPVTTMAAMHNTMSQLVLVQEACMTVVGGPLITTKLQACTFELLAEADIESHITVIGVHIQAQIFTNLVPHNKGVMPVEV